jgi:long-chain acyl-CoA synthetase
MSASPPLVLADVARAMTEAPCRLTELVAGMPARTGSTIFAHREGGLTGIPFPDCHRDAVALAAALRARGVGPGHRVALHGTTSYEWVLADIACLLAGALSVALYPSVPPARAVAVAAESGCRVVFTDRPEFVPAFRGQGADVILLRAGDSTGTPSVAGLLAGGGDIAGFQPAARGAAPFTIVSTSGTLSEPKLFAVHSAPLLYTMDRFAEIYQLSDQDRLLLYLPLSHLPQRMMLYWALGTGMDLVLSDPAHIAADTRQASPTLHVAVPRSLAHLHQRATEIARRSGQKTGLAAFRPVFGPAIRAIFVGSAASDPAVLSDLIAAGLPVYEVYGTTELGMIAISTPAARRAGTVGKAIPWGQVRIDPANGEVLVRTPTPFLFGRLSGTEIEIDGEARGQWARTGDLGTLDADGYLRLRGRLRDFLVLGSGEKVFVRPIEEALAKATGAELCVVSQAARTGLRALLFFGSGSPDPAGCRGQLAALNQTLHPWERVRAFAAVGRLPSIEEGALTETTKVRRHKIEEIYARNAAWHHVGDG